MRISVTMTVRGISRYLRNCGVYLGVQLKTSTARVSSVPQPEVACNQLIEAYDKLSICVIKIINNLLNTYDNYTEIYKILFNLFKKVTSQVKD